jgi:WD40 repeat protein/tRNA A-37 threonylcarbamoyl transferase component Bud32
LRAELEALEQDLKEQKATPDNRAAQAATRPYTIAEALTIAPAFEPTLPQPGEACSSAHGDATVPPREEATVDLGSSAPASAEAAKPSRVRYFGDYEILREIARGGMGVVYKARQVSLNRAVALKMILAGQLADEADVRRFQLEAEAAANLDHPGIVPIFEVGQHEGQHYFSMGFVEGQSLSQRLADGPLPPREAAALMLKVAEAIDYAHQRGVIHRDLKPGNILIDAKGHPRVTDFGLAKRLQSDSGLTGSGQIMGTPSYMPPEQAGGNRGEVGSVADVYALGATLYALVTGRPPFQAATPMDTVLQVLSDEPVPPRRLNASIPRDLETICLKCLRKEPGKRYATAMSLADDLRRYLAGEPILARPVTRLERAVKWARRRPAIAAMSLAIALLSAGGITGILVQWRRAEWHRSRAEAFAGETLVALDSATRRLYASSLQLAWQAWKRGHAGKTVDLLRDAKETLTPGSPDRRLELVGFEWDYLWRLSQGSRQTWDSPHGMVVALAFSPDGKTLASSGWGLAVDVRDVASGRTVRSLTGHSGSVLALAFSPDGETLASGGLDGAVKLWDARTGRERETLDIEERHAVRALAWSPNGDLLAAGTDPPAVSVGLVSVDGEPKRSQKFSGWGDGNVNVWNVAGRSVRLSKPKGELWGPVSALAFSPDGSRLILACRTTFRPEGNRLVTKPGDVAVLSAKTAVVEELQRWNLSRNLPASPKGVRAVAISPDSAMVALALGRMGDAQSYTSAGEVVLLDLGLAREMKVLATLKGHTAGVNALSFSPDGKSLASAGDDETLRIWDVDTRQERFVHLGQAEPINAIAFHPDGLSVATGGGRHPLEEKRIDGSSGHVKLWSTFDDQAKTRVGIPPAPPVLTAPSRVISPDGLHFATATGAISSSTFKPALAMWDVRTSGAIWSRNGLYDFLTFSRNRRMLASGPFVVQLWDVPTGREIRSFPNPDREAVNAISFSWDGTSLAAAFRGNGAVQLWDVASGRLRTELNRYEHPMMALAFSPDGTLLATGSGYKWVSEYTAITQGIQEEPATVTLWDLSRPGTRVTLNGHKGAVNAMAFSSDGKTLATGALDQTVRLWDVAERRERAVLREHVGILRALAFSPNGKTLASAGDDRVIRLRDPFTGQERFALEGHASPVLSLVFLTDERTLASSSRDELFLWPSEDRSSR